MLSYAYNVLKQDSFAKFGEEEFENIYDLLTEILIIGVRKQVKQGLIKNIFAAMSHYQWLEEKLILVIL